MVEVMCRGYEQTYGGYGDLRYTNALQSFEAFEKLSSNFREIQVSVRDLLKMLIHKKYE